MKAIIIIRVNSHDGEVGAKGIKANLATDRHPIRTNTKRPSIAFAVTSIAISLALLGAKLMGLSAQSLIESPGTFLPVR